MSPSALLSLPASATVTAPLPGCYLLAFSVLPASAAALFSPPAPALLPVLPKLVPPAPPTIASATFSSTGKQARQPGH